MKRIGFKAAMAALALATSPLAIGLAAVPAAAQMPGTMESVPLTPSMIENVIASYAAVKAAAPEMGMKYGATADGGAGAMGILGAMEASSELNGLVTQYGFPDFQSWLKATMSVAMAYSFAREGGQMDDKMAEAVAEIKNNQSIPAAQKEALLAQLQASTAAIQAIRPPQANVDAIAPYMTQLSPLLN